MCYNILKTFTSNGKATMTIPDTDLTYLITNSKYVLSYYDMAEVNKIYNCPTGKLAEMLTVFVWLF
jgi:hypothetical protein